MTQSMVDFHQKESNPEILKTERTITEAEEFDASCPVCYKIMQKPAATNCKHYFCLRCIVKVQK